MIFVDVGVDVNVGDDNDNDDDDIELFIPNSIKLLFNLVNKSYQDHHQDYYFHL